MPTYEYQCDACGHNFDEFQGINDKPLRKCPKCRKSKLRRVFGIGAAVIFKGSGFYQTDYRSESYKAAEKAEQESSKPATDSKTDKSEKTAKTETDTSGNGKTDAPTKSTKKSPKSAT
jgi:putative FmdB family regulatory protein